MQLEASFEVKRLAQAALVESEAAAEARQTAAAASASEANARAAQAEAAVSQLTGELQRAQQADRAERGACSTLYFILYTL